MSAGSDIAKVLTPQAPSITLGVGLPGEAIGAAAVNLTTEVLKIENSPAMVQAAIERHAQAAKDALQRAIDNGDLESLRKMAAILPEAA